MAMEDAATRRGTQRISGTPLSPVAASMRLRIWDPFVRVFHWLLAIGFAVNFFELVRPGRYPHRVIGYVILSLIAARLIWGLIGSRHARFADFVRAPGELFDHLRAILRKFVVHQNHAFAGGHHGDVAAAADDDIQIFRHLLHGELSRRLVLRPANPESRAEQGRDGYTCQKDFRRKHVLWIYHVPERERKFRSFSSAHARPAVRLT